ncbi:DUF3857 domain-containing protein [Nonlabens sp. Ci31]|uniref:DUF3857 domain-containing protein n=1 Tax=Nonlabens sp. Ci31 TaxID=2608253 RepID=UPI0014628A49|nr:DUF3857 domain-containing protein [Nonlabens sp. Ci31]QJP33097.1 DUF3857 domain-containing protein [Nonlabens sp. Ci31]
MNYQFLLTAFLLFSISLQAQEAPYYESYDWSDQPSYMGKDYGDQEIVGLFSNVVSEFYFVDSKSLVEYYMEHEILLLNSDKIIEQYNKVYLPYDDRKEIVLHKVRVINIDGSVIEVGKDKIFDAKDEETGNQYQYFALEGLEKGSVLERMYVYKRYPQYNGKYLRLQEDYDKNEVSFQLFAPSNLIFAFKSYNGLPQAVVKENDSKNHWIISVDKLEAIDKEEGASYNANTAHVIYKLDSNTASSSENYASYATVAKNIYKNLNEELSKRESKELDKFIKNAVVGNSLDEKLSSLDNYIKENIFKTDIEEEKYNSVPSVLKNKIGTDTGIIKLYLASLNLMEIDHEIVLTSSRSSEKFDPEFEAYNYLQNYLIYFPETKKYTSPDDFSTRYGYPDGYLTDNYGLFITKVKVGNFESSVGEVKFIPAVSAKDTQDIMRLDVKFSSKDNSVIEVDLRNELTGYSAASLQPFIFRLDDDTREEIMLSYAHRLTEDMEITEKVMMNVEKGDFGKAPLIMNYKFSSSDFIEKAGRKSLFKIGKLIGAQTELYQEKERKLPYENTHNRTYDREITVYLPDGYTIPNLDDIKIDKQFKNDKGETVFYFKSDYTLEGNILKVIANEFYDQTVVLPSNYEEYRTVINSAADFEKISLILQSK